MQKKENTLNVKISANMGFLLNCYKNIEYTHGKNGALGIDLEIVILMKNNEKFPVDLMYYTKSKGNYYSNIYTQIQVYFQLVV